MQRFASAMASASASGSRRSSKLPSADSRVNVITLRRNRGT
jgi:hypothetical protein